MARNLRSNLTESEARLWSRLRGKQLLGVQFYRQKPIGNYIVGFFAPRVKLVIEVDGSQHRQEAELSLDKIRDTYLANLGLKVLRFNSRKVLENTNAVVEVIGRAMATFLGLEIPADLPLEKGGGIEPSSLPGATADKPTLHQKTSQTACSFSERRQQSHIFPPLKKGGRGDFEKKAAEQRFSEQPTQSVSQAESAANTDRKTEATRRYVLRISDLKALNIEISSKCIGRCPFCSRRQKVRPYGEYLITTADFKLLPVSFIKRLKILTFAGNFGDLCSNPDLPEIAAYVRELNPAVRMGGDTNGSLQTASWWKALGPLFRDGCMIFSLDGLADTHAIHRRGTDFSRIVANIKAFTAAGGAAYWKFIVFKHNEHQISQAEAMARDIGCARFFVISSRDYDERCQRPQTFDFRLKREIFSAYRQKLSPEKMAVRCKPRYSGAIYIAADGSVHPCCFAHCMYITEHNRTFRFVVSLIEKYKARINFKTTPLAEIVSGPYFEAVLTQSGTNPYCATKCNKFKKEIRKEVVLHDVFFERFNGSRFKVQEH